MRGVHAPPFSGKRRATPTMFPILFRIPLPHMPLKLWWALAAVAAIAVVYAALGLRRRDRNGPITAAGRALPAGAAGDKWQGPSYRAPTPPIYPKGCVIRPALGVRGDPR